jgi:hypothetical protein
MKELLEFAWDVLLFRDEAYAQHVARADVLKRGVALLVLVTLLAGLIPFFVNVINDLRLASVEARRQEAEVGIQEFVKSLDAVRPYLDLPPGFEKQMIAYNKAGMGIGFGIEDLPTRLPKPVGRVLRDLGAFLSLPFSRLAGWMGYALWVLLVAKLLGGRATVSQMLGATALYAVPHILDFLGFVSCLGPMIGLVATVWGIAIYVKALTVASDFSIGRAITATIVPALIIAALSLLGMLMLFVLVLATG